MILRLGGCTLPAATLRRQHALVGHSLKNLEFSLHVFDGFKGRLEDGGRWSARQVETADQIPDIVARGSNDEVAWKMDPDF